MRSLPAEANKLRLVGGAPGAEALARPLELKPSERAEPGRRLPRGRVRLLVAADLLSIGIALGVMTVVAESMAPPAYIGPSWALAIFAVVAPLGWISLFAAYRLYESQSRAISPNSFDEVTTLFHALLAGSLVYLLAGQVLRRAADWSVYTPVEAVLFLAVAIVLVPTLRGAVRTWVLPRLLLPRRTLIVGAGEVGHLVKRKLARHPEFGLELIGFVDDDPRVEGVVGRTDDLTRLVDELDIDWVLLAPSDTPHERLVEMVRAVRRPEVHLSIIPNFYELFASNATIEDLEGVPVVSLPPMRFSRSVRAVKRSFDVVAAGLGLLAIAPVLLVAAIAIRLDSPGPVFFRQRRHGRGGREFHIVKFRTMVQDAEAKRFELAHLNQMEGGGPLFKIHDDPRVTRVGRLLRKWSIDELPQLWNVVKGEMSLVGPRPFVVHESELITGWGSRRLETTPGITGLWQVLGRNDIPFEEMVKLDYIYVTNWSLWWDVKILCQTLPVVLAKQGAY